MCVNFTSDMRGYQLHVRVKVCCAQKRLTLSLFLYRMLRTEAVHSEA